MPFRQIREVAPDALVIHLLDTDEFYDLEKDIYEMHNLIHDESYSERAA